MPTEPCGEPSGFRKPNPTIPGGPSGLGFESIESGEDLAQESTRYFHIGIENQQPGALRDSPAGVHTGGKAPVVRAKDDPLTDAVERECLWHGTPRGIVHHHDLTAARGKLGLFRQRCRELLHIRPAFVVDDDHREPWPLAGSSTVRQSLGVILLFHANDLESARY